MKNPRKLFGIISIIAAIACAMAACNPEEPDQTPSADDYVIGNLKQEAGSITAVTVTPKTGKSPGARTIWYEGIGDTAYARSTSVPTGASGSTYAIYNVTFDVAAADGWTEAKGLFAGLLTIGSPTPVAGDYEVNGLWQTVGVSVLVTITPRPGKSPGARTIYYAGTGSTTYAKSATPPSALGTYAVTFDVAAATVWNPAAGLSAGDLVISDPQAWTISAEIIGTPGVGKKLVAGVKTNFAGELSYEWYANGQKIQYETYHIFYPSLAHYNKQITVKITCKGASGTKDTTSPAVTIPAFQWGVLIEQYTTRIWAWVEINDATFDANDGEFRIEWYRGSDKISGQNESYYDINPAADAGKQIWAKITGYGSSKDTDKIQIQAAPVIPEPTNDWTSHDSITEAEIYIMMWDIDRAYAQNINSYKTIIEDKADSWRIDFHRDATDEKAEIVDGQLQIHFSTEWYEGIKNGTDIYRLSMVGQKLSVQAQTAVFISKYTGDYEDIRMANLGAEDVTVTKEPSDRRSAVVTDFS